MTDWLEYHVEPVTLHSGQKSHWLVRADLIYLDINLREEVLKYWQQALDGDHWFYGIPDGGVPWALAIAERVGGEYSDEYEPGMVIVDDVTTTGASISIGVDSKHLVVVSRNAFLPPNTTAWCTMSLSTESPTRAVEAVAEE